MRWSPCRKSNSTFLISNLFKDVKGALKLQAPEAYHYLNQGDTRLFGSQLKDPMLNDKVNIGKLYKTFENYRFLRATLYALKTR